MKKYSTEIIIVLLIITTGLVIYAQLGNYDYILYDDMLSIYGPCAVNGLSMEERGRAYFKMADRIPYQVPIPAIVRLVLFEFFGDDMGKHHLFSVYLHITCALLLFLFLRSGTGKIPESGFCAILFTVHPINAEAISWLAGYNGMLEAFFLMITLTCYYYYVKSPSWKRYLLVFPPFILGLMCKPTMAILPFLLFLLDYWPFRRFSLNRTDMKDMALRFGQNKIIVEKLPFIALVPFQWAAERLITTGQLWGDKRVSLTFHPGSIVDFAFHLKKVIYPTGLAICRPDPLEASLWTAIGLLGVLLLISVLLLWRADTRRHLITGWFWFLVASAPVMLMVLLSGRPVEDHHFYIPLIGLFIIISFGVPSIMPTVKYGRYLLTVAGIIVLAVLITMSRLQTRHWENSITVFSHAIAIYPGNKKAHANLGDAYMGINEIDKAIHHYRRFLSISPDSALGYTKLANALAAADMMEEATRHYQKALDLSPGYAPALHGLADLLIRKGETGQAIALYRMALKNNPDLFQTLNNLALALYEQGDYSEALAYLDQAIRLNPHYRTAVINRRLIMDSLEKGSPGRP